MYVQDAGAISKEFYYLVRTLGYAKKDGAFERPTTTPASPEAHTRNIRGKRSRA
jgi:hypothetical protein